MKVEDDRLEERSFREEFVINCKKAISLEKSRAISEVNNPESNPCNIVSDK